LRGDLLYLLYVPKFEGIRVSTYLFYHNLHVTPQGYLALLQLSESGFAILDAEVFEEVKVCLQAGLLF